MFWFIKSMKPNYAKKERKWRWTLPSLLKTNKGCEQKPLRNISYGSNGNKSRLHIINTAQCSKTRMPKYLTPNYIWYLKDHPAITALGNYLYIYRLVSAPPSDCWRSRKQREKNFQQQRELPNSRRWLDNLFSPKQNTRTFFFAKMEASVCTISWPWTFRY